MTQPYTPDPEAPLSLRDWLVVLGPLAWFTATRVVPILTIGWFLFYIVGPVLTHMVGG